MSIEQEAKQAMEGSLEHFKKELRGLRTGRATPSILEGLKVEAYGTMMSLRELGNVTVAEAQQLLITPFDPQMGGPIAKAIEKSNLGLLPALEGHIVRVPIPPLTEETRKGIVKQAKEKVEEAKVSVRDVRRKSNDAAKKEKTDGNYTEDDLKRTEKQIQELTDSYCKQIDDLFLEKEKDLMKV